MHEYNLILYIVIISLFQILLNFIFNLLIKKSIAYSEMSLDNKFTKDRKVFSIMLFILNSICFMYSMYYLLIFIKTFLLPEFIEIFLSLKPVL